MGVEVEAARNPFHGKNGFEVRPEMKRFDPFYLYVRLYSSF